MSLSEVEFAFFFPLFLLVHWLLPRRASLQNAALLLASLVFYASWNVRLLPLLLASTAIDWAVLRGFARTPLPTDDAPEAERARALGRRRRLLALGVAQNLAALIWFKYVGFFADSFNTLFGAIGLGASLPVLRIVLPLGISFYTMSRIGVLLDTYYGRLEPVKSPLVWFTFTSFFPQLIAGPIGRGAELFPQYESPRRADPAAFSRAVGELAIGFVLKVYVSAQAAEWANPVFASPGAFTRFGHVLGLVGYALQVFGDFAGYSLIAIGVGRLLGISLPENFNFPFLATTPMDIWRRWHMSLNRWLFDYVYAQMVTGDGWMRGRLGLGLVLVMLVSGVWHGASWTFVLWGFLHGLWLLVHYQYDLYYKSLCRKDKAWVARRKTRAYKLAGWALSVGFFVVTLIPFRAASLADCAAFLGGLVAGGGEPLAASTMHPWLALVLVVAWHVAQLPVFAGLRERVRNLPAPVRGFALGLSVILLFVFAPVGAGTFIYAQF